MAARMHSLRGRWVLSNRLSSLVRSYTWRKQGSTALLMFACLQLNLSLNIPTEIVLSFISAVNWISLFHLEITLKFDPADVYDKAYLNLALSLGYHQRYRQIYRVWRSISRFPTIVFKLDFLEKIAVSLNVDELVTKLIGHAYRMLVEINQRNHVNYAYQAPLNSRGKWGKPSYKISEE